MIRIANTHFPRIRTYIGIGGILGLDEDRTLAGRRPDNTALGDGLLVGSYRRSAASL